MWVGASVHDVGQVVATAQIAGATALAVAVVVKLTRVSLLAPMVALAGVVVARSDRKAAAASAPLDAPGASEASEASASTAADLSPVKRPAILPLFVVGFLAAVLVRTFVPLPDSFLEVAAYGQELVLGMALFGLGAAISVRNLIRTGGRALAVALISWAVVALLSLGAVEIARAAGVAALG
jgi:uncharacterized membrane protein YadS